MLYLVVESSLFSPERVKKFVSETQAIEYSEHKKMKGWTTEIYKVAEKINLLEGVFIHREEA